MNKLFFAVCLSLFLTGCTRTDLRDVIEPENPVSGNGKCEIHLSVSNLPELDRTVTRWCPQRLTDGPLTLSISEADVPVTRTFAATSLFGANSHFRMLVFKGAFGTGNVDMDTPVENVECQVDAEGKTALFVQPTSLELAKGDYVFVCFPADEKYNLWTVGKSAAATKCNMIPIAQDEDFVCLTTEALSIGNEAYTLQLGTFTRTGFQLTVNFKNESGYDLTAPTGTLSLTVSDNGTTNHIINTGAKVNVTNKEVAEYTGHSLTADISISKPEDTQLFTGQTFFLIANNAASEKLTIAYPELTVNGKQIASGTYTSEEAVNFKAGRTYTFTFTLKNN